VSGLKLLYGWEGLATAVDGQRAARLEEASEGPVAGERRVTRDPHHGSLALEVRDGEQQALGVGVAR
jgi:hypothetical protein